MVVLSGITHNFNPFSSLSLKTEMTKETRLYIDGAAAIWANSLLQNKRLVKLDFKF